MTTNQTAPIIRLARSTDLNAIVRIIAEDESGLHSDSPDGDQSHYQHAFAAIEADPRNELFVADAEGHVVGTFQLTYLPHIFDHGRERAQIEALFVASSARGRGIGSALIAFALDRARKRGCALVQLNSNKSRKDAHRFYEAAGFTCSHEGFKAVL